MAESEQKQLNEAITDGQQQPVADEAGDLVPGGVPPADVVSAPGPTRDSHGKFVATTPKLTCPSESPQRLD